MLSKLLFKVFIAKVWQEDCTHSFWAFLKDLLKSVTNSESLAHFKTIIKSVTENYYKVWKVLQSESEFIAKCEKRLLKSVTHIRKCDYYYVTTCWITSPILG